MDYKEFPPPYTSSADEQTATFMDRNVPSPQFPNKHRTPPPVPVPTFQQPFMNQPTAPPPAAVTTTVNISTGPPVRAGSCPVCHGTSWTGNYSCCAWLWCICCFPIGIICCCCMRKKKCSKCGFTLG